ncbi:MAG TPA: hypothetical protein VL362_03640 [Patescibacteria group bacterium]|jgi:TM2 domain-containing membrane protein YozV|nr:hypothetical protein [Patescibacteria group bacterium]
MDQDQQPKDQQQPEVGPQPVESTPVEQPIQPEMATPAESTPETGQSAAEPAQPAMSEPENTPTEAPEPLAQPSVVPEPVVAPTHDQAVEAPAAQDRGSRNFLAAFLMTVSLGYYGLHQVYLGRKVQGWIRFGLAIAAFPLMFVLVGFLIVPVLAIWAAVDFFMVYLGKRVDGEGKPLTASEHDKSWARIIFIVILVLYGLYIALVALGMMFGVLSGLQQRNNPMPSSTFPDYSTTRSY